MIEGGGGERSNEGVNKTNLGEGSGGKSGEVWRGSRDVFGGCKVCQERGNVAQAGCCQTEGSLIYQEGRTRHRLALPSAPCLYGRPP